MHAVAPLIDESSGESPLTVEYPGNGVVRFNAAIRVAIKRYNHAVTWATRHFISLISISKKYESNFKEISKLHLLVVIYECTSGQRKHRCVCVSTASECVIPVQNAWALTWAVLKIWRHSSRAVAIRQRWWRRFLCAYMLPIRDLCFLRFIVLCFLRKKIINNVAFRHRSDVYAAWLMDLRNR